MSIQTKFRGLKEVWQFDNRVWLTFTKTFFPRENLQVYRYKGMDILIDHSAGDANGAREILTSPMYRRFFPLMKLHGLINVLDLGANNGGFPLLLQSAGLQLKKVVSLELNPKTFTRLRFNLERNLHCQVIALNAALCGETGFLKVALSPGSVADSIYNDTESGDEQICEVEGLSLDEIWRRHFADEKVDLCKMDVEGAEFDVFLQTSHQSLRRCRYLIMEIHERGERRAQEILPVIEGLGFIRQPTDPDADQAVHFFINSEFE